MAQPTTVLPLAPTPVTGSEKSSPYARRRHEAAQPAGSEPLSRFQVPEDS
jgi:hypothetical protein